MASCRVQDDLLSGWLSWPLENQQSTLSPPSFLAEILKSLGISRILWGLSSHDFLSLYTFFYNTLGFYTIFIYLWNLSLHFFLQNTQRNIPEHCRLDPRPCGQMVVTMGARKESFPNYLFYSLKNLHGLSPLLHLAHINSWLLLFTPSFTFSCFLFIFTLFLEPKTTPQTTPLLGKVVAPYFLNPWWSLPSWPLWLWDRRWVEEASPFT